MPVMSDEGEIIVTFSKLVWPNHTAAVARRKKKKRKKRRERKKNPP